MENIKIQMRNIKEGLCNFGYDVDDLRIYEDGKLILVIITESDGKKYSASICKKTMIYKSSQFSNELEIDFITQYKKVVIKNGT